MQSSAYASWTLGTKYWLKKPSHTSSVKFKYGMPLTTFIIVNTAGAKASHRERHRQYCIHRRLRSQHLQPAMREKPFYSYPF